MSGLRVWVITPELHRHGGTERCLAEQIERWKDRFDLRLYTMRTQGVDLDGIDVRDIPYLPGPHLTTWLWWFVANGVRRWWDARSGEGRPTVHSPGVNALDADAICVHITFTKLWEQTSPGVLHDLRRRSTTVRAIHRIVYYAIVRRLERWIYQRPVSLWATSMTDAKRLEELFRRPRGSIPVIPHGVDTEKFSPARCGERRNRIRRELGFSPIDRLVLLIGNDMYGKGIDHGMRALRALPSDVHLITAGRLDEAQVDRWARDAGVQDRVHHLPHTPDVVDYYAIADLLVAPSREDAFGLPPLEAMACGIPVVVSARAGVAELVEDERQAMLVEDPGEVDALGRAISRVLEEPELAERLANEGRALAEEHSWDENARRAGDLIDREATIPRVLILASDPREHGGIGRATRNLLSALSERYGDDRVGVLPVWGSDSSNDLPGWQLVEGLAGSPRPTRLVERLRYVVTAIHAGRRWRRRLVVVASHPHLSPVARLVAKAAGCRYAVWAHGHEVWGPMRSRVAWGLRGASAIWAASTFTAEQVRRNRMCAPERVSVLPHGLPPELDHVEPTPSTDPIVLSVARLTRRNAYKGIDTLLQAWPRIVQRVPDARLRIIGDGDDRERLERFADELGIASTVRFVGHVSDRQLARAYSAARLFALPARVRTGDDPGGEGFGLVFIEAAAAGLPVVAGAVGGAVEAVQHGETGLLVDPNDPVAVADAIAALMDDPDRAAAMGRAGRRWVTDAFSYESFRDRVTAEVRGLADLPDGA